jgi:predicted helicase
MLSTVISMCPRISHAVCDNVVTTSRAEGARSHATRSFAGATTAANAQQVRLAGQRFARLQHLRSLDRGERGLLANARCLAEGVDVPVLDGVAFIDPRRLSLALDKERQA